MGNQQSARVVAGCGIVRILHVLLNSTEPSLQRLKRVLKTLLAVALYGFAVGGPQHPVLYTLFGINKPRVSVNGHVEPGYEKVRELFQKHLDDGLGHGMQCCAFVKGKKVVDLWGSQDHYYRGKKVEYNQRTLQNVFSSTKVVSSIVFAVAADKGWLSLDDKVSSIWPEFAAHNKESITVSMVLCHDAGMYDIEAKFTTEDLHPSGIKQGSLSSKLAAEKSVNPGDRRYHAVSRGLILNEIFRRVHPNGLTIGQFVQAEISKPLGVDFFVGLPKEVAHDDIHHQDLTVAPIDHHPVPWTILQSFIPKVLGRQVPFNFLWLFPRLANDFYRLLVLGKTFPFIPKRKDQVNFLDVFNDPHIREAELPSANGHSNASSMARIASELAQGGGMLISQQGLDAAESGTTRKLDQSAETHTTNTKAGLTVFDESSIDNRDGFVGWLGYGGSALQWHRKLQIGFAYAMNCCYTDVNNMHFGFFHKDLQMEILRVAKLQEQP